jgi:type IV pilus assembly protein PilQ
MPNQYQKALPNKLILVIALLSMLSSFPAFAADKESIINNRVLGGDRLFTIEVRDAEIKDILRALAQQSNMGIIISRGVKEKVTFSFKDITLKDALDLLLKAYGYNYTIENDVIWVGEEDDIPKEEDILEIIQLNYAKASTISKQFKKIIGNKGEVTSDARTNTIILKGNRKNLDEIRSIYKSLLKELDKQPYQVVIEARIVEASTSFSRSLGIQWGGSYAFNGGRNTITGSQIIRTQSAAGRNFAVNLPPAGPTGGLGMVIGSLKNNLFLDIELAAAEQEGRARIISRPKITTLNKQTATIHSGLTFRVKTINTTTTTTTTAAAAVAAANAAIRATIEEVETGIDLTVTPEISSDGFVILNIDIQKSEPDFSRTIDGIPGVTEKSASANVLVKDGETTVIGGLLRNSSSNSDTRVPFFSKIPVVGWLFKSRSSTSDREELLVFITPNIVRQDRGVEH